MKNLYYNKSLTIDKYFWTNLSQNELHHIHNTYEYFIFKGNEYSLGEFNPKSFDYELVFKKENIISLDEFFNINNDEFIILKSLLRMFKRYSITYIKCDINKLKKYVNIENRKTFKK
jgi:hypothetical protein